MKEINIFCFGFGQVAKNFIKKLSIEKYNINLSITSRSKSAKENFRGINYNSYLFNSFAPNKVTSSDVEGLSSDKLYISPDLNFDKDLNNMFEISST